MLNLGEEQRYYKQGNRETGEQGNGGTGKPGNGKTGKRVNRENLTVKNYPLLKKHSKERSHFSFSLHIIVSVFDIITYQKTYVMENKIHSFEDLIIWQEGVQLSVEIYKCLSDCKDFKLRDQIQKSSVSIPSNIAEGFERGFDKEFIRFLFYAKSSAGELRTQLYIAKAINILEAEKCDLFIDKTKRIASMIQNLINKKKNDLKLLKDKYRN